jgi:hypothetical protein
VAPFDGGRLSSDGGLLVPSEIERQLGIADRLAACIDDPHRAHTGGHHSLPAGMIAAGYEDGNDATGLRIDPVFKMASSSPPVSGGSGRVGDPWGPRRAARSGVLAAPRDA